MQNSKMTIEVLYSVQKPGLKEALQQSTTIKLDVSRKPAKAIISPFIQHCVCSNQCLKQVLFVWAADFRETKIVCYGIHKNEQKHLRCILTVSSWVNVVYWCVKVIPKVVVWS